MAHRRHGFTLIEVVIVLTVGVILTSIAMNAFSNVRGRFAVSQARNTFVSLHSRARANAIEFGETTRLWVDVSTDSVWVERGGTQVEVVSFDRALNVDIQGSLTQLRLCMNPRGFATTSCNNFNTTQTLTFASPAGDTASIRIRTLGQLSY